MSLPRLDLATWQSRLAMSLVFTSGGAILAFLWALGGLSTSETVVSAIVTYPVVSVLVWMAVHRLFLPFASTIPRGCETIRGTVLASLGRAPSPPEGTPKSWHPDEAWAVLRELVAEQVGVSRDEVTEDKHFIHDFGMD